MSAAARRLRNLRPQALHRRGVRPSRVISLSNNPRLRDVRTSRPPQNGQRTMLALALFWVFDNLAALP